MRRTVVGMTVALVLAALPAVAEATPVSAPTDIVVSKERWVRAMTKAVNRSIIATAAVPGAIFVADDLQRPLYQVYLNPDGTIVLTTAAVAGSMTLSDRVVSCKTKSLCWIKEYGTMEWARLANGLRFQKISMRRIASSVPVQTYWLEACVGGASDSSDFEVISVNFCEDGATIVWGKGKSRQMVQQRNYGHPLNPDFPDPTKVVKTSDAVFIIPYFIEMAAM